MSSLTEQRAKPLIVIGPTSGWQAIDFGEIWQFRNLLWNLALRDVKLRYKQTALGVLWVILQPIISAGVITVVFGKVAKMPSDGVPYFIFSYSGLVAWTLFSVTVTKASSSLVGNSHLVSKVYFPRLILPFYTVLSTLQDSAISLAVFFVAMLLNGITPGFPILAAPVFALLLLTAGMGIGLISAALTVHYRDVSTLLSFLIGLFMYLCPVAYSTRAIPPGLRFWYHLNPLSPLIAGFRWSLLDRGSIDIRGVIYAAAVAFTLLCIGLMSFRRMEKQFADVI